jgi:hypothetical protein
MKVPKVQPPYRTFELRINSSSKHHSPNRVRARAAKRDNFVVAVFNINENVRPAFPVDSGSPSEETAVALHRKSFTTFRPLSALPSAPNLWEAKNYQLCKTVTDRVDYAL